MEENVPVNEFGRTVSRAEKYTPASKIANSAHFFAMTTNSDVIVTLLITNFHLYPIHLWW